MRKTFILLAVVAVASVAIAQPRLRKQAITTGALTAGTNTITDVAGYLDEIEVFVSNGTSTGLVTVTIGPTDSTASTVAAYNIATNTVTDSKRWRPRLDVTNVGGDDLTGDAPSKVLLIGDTITWVISGSQTSVTWRIRIKYDDGR